MSYPGLPREVRVPRVSEYALDVHSRGLATVGSRQASGQRSWSRRPGCPVSQFIHSAADQPKGQRNAGEEVKEAGELALVRKMTSGDAYRCLLDGLRQPTLDLDHL